MSLFYSTLTQLALGQVFLQFLPYESFDAVTRDSAELFMFWRIFCQQLLQHFPPPTIGWFFICRLFFTRFDFFSDIKCVQYQAFLAVLVILPHTNLQGGWETFLKLRNVGNMFSTDITILQIYFLTLSQLHISSTRSIMPVSIFRYWYTVPVPISW